MMFSLLFLSTLMNECLICGFLAVLWNNTLPKRSPRKADIGRWDHRTPSTHNNLWAKNRSAQKISYSKLQFEFGAQRPNFHQSQSASVWVCELCFIRDQQSP